MTHILLPLKSLAPGPLDPSAGLGLADSQSQPHKKPRPFTRRGKLQPCQQHWRMGEEGRMELDEASSYTGGVTREGRKGTWQVMTSFEGGEQPWEVSSLSYLL